MKKPVIIGIDFGKNVGISILDFEGNILHLATLKDVKFGEIVSYLKNFGLPLIVSCDVPSSKQAKKLSSYFGAKLFIPKIPLSIKEKIKLTKEYYYEDLHQRDALASSLKAFKYYRKIIIKINEEIKENKEKAIIRFFKTFKNIKEVKKETESTQ